MLHQLSWLAIAFPAVFCVALGLLTSAKHLFNPSNSASFISGGRVRASGSPSHQPDFAWDELPPSKALEWVTCHTDFQCARLIVPLDYANPTDREASIALIRIPAAVPRNSEQYKGPILINPGGPGGSGVSAVMIGGQLLSTIIGPEFDIVGFDPRGIARSTPAVSFFKTDVERALFATPDIVHLEDGTLSHLLAGKRLLNSLASDSDDGYLRHINTDHTARDMLRIVEAHGRDKIMYWGFSYGSILGATFAAMFPDKVERIIIDGVADAPGHYANDWSSALQDTDKALDTFFVGCSNAGPDVCPFYAPSPEEIQKNLTNIFAQLRRSPIPVKIDSKYGLLDESLLRNLIFQALYSPYPYFPILAEGLAALAKGDPKPLFSLQPPLYQCQCGPEEEKEPGPKIYHETLASVLCNDGDYIPETIEFAEKALEGYLNKSDFGSIWFTVSGSTCAGWPKFNRDHLFRGPFNVTTSHPLLLIGNTADPVTPLASAKKMSRLFHGSVLLTQDSVGHCSVAAPSVCTMKYVREYFLNGTLPKEGTVCPTIRGPFDPESSRRLGGDASAQQALLTAEEASWVEKVNELSMTPIVQPVGGVMRERGF